jgi:hypothetical protein
LVLVAKMSVTLALQTSERASTFSWRWKLWTLDAMSELLVPLVAVAASSG